jgi:hypothetical protein
VTVTRGEATCLLECQGCRSRLLLERGFAVRPVLDRLNAFLGRHHACG